jgi:hypothetical protein
VGEVGIDAPISSSVGVAQRTLGNVTAKAGVVQFRLHGAQARFDIPKAFAIRQLCEGHRQELVAAGEISDPVVATIATHAFVEIPFGNEIHQLSENQSALVHRKLLCTSWCGGGGENARAS